MPKRAPTTSSGPPSPTPESLPSAQELTCHIVDKKYCSNPPSSSSSGTGNVDSAQPKRGENITKRSLTGSEETPEHRCPATGHGIYQSTPIDGSVSNPLPKPKRERLMTDASEQCPAPFCCSGVNDNGYTVKLKDKTASTGHQRSNKEQLLPEPGSK
eukprot:gene4480-4722_t